MIIVACPCSQPGNFTQPRVSQAKPRKTGTRRSPAPETTNPTPAPEPGTAAARPALPGRTRIRPTHSALGNPAAHHRQPQPQPHHRDNPRRPRPHPIRAQIHQMKLFEITSMTVSMPARFTRCWLLVASASSSVSREPRRWWQWAPCRGSRFGELYRMTSSNMCGSGMGGPLWSLRQPA
jgi:hypothetical protein